MPRDVEIHKMATELRKASDLLRFLDNQRLTFVALAADCWEYSLKSLVNFDWNSLSYLESGKAI